MSEATVSAARHYRGWRWIPPFLLAVLLVVAWLAGNSLLDSYVALEFALANGWVPTLAMALVAYAVWLATSREAMRLRICAASPLLVLVSVGVLLTVMPEPDSGREEIYHVHSTDGPGTVVVYEDRDFGHWDLELRWGNGLTERQWKLGSVTPPGSVFRGPPPQVSWLESDRVLVHEIRLGELTERTGQVVVELDDSSGRPQATITELLNEQYYTRD